MALDGLRQDLAQAGRTLVRRFGFSVTVVLTLALGVGGTTTMFGIVNGVLLAPLAFPEPHRLVRLWESDPRRPFRDLAPANFLDARAGTPGLQHLTAYRRTSRNLVGSGEPERLSVASVSSNFFSTLGVAPVRGASFGVGPTGPGEARSVVLAHGFWTRRFAGDPGVIGSTLRLDEETVTVAGVMPPSFDFPPEVSLWIPAPLDVPPTGPLAIGGDHTRERSSWYFDAVGRLAPGATVERVQAELDAVAARIREIDPESNAETSFRLVPLHDATVRDARSTLLMLFGAVSFLLMIACANVAALALVRTSERQQELAVRAALGAGRLRILRHVLAENAALGTLGGGLGLGAALVAVGWMRTVPALPRAAELGVDLRVIGFALGITALTTVVFGALPALASVPDRPAAALGPRSGRSRGSSARLRRMLVVGEVALAVVLVLGASLTLQSLWRLSQVDLGIRTADLVVMRFSLPGGRAQSPEEWIAAYERIASAVQAIPGVQASGLSSSDPLTPGWRAGLRVLGRPFDGNDPLDVGWSAVTPGYFDALGPQIVEGRGFDARDRSDSRPVALVNQTFAAQVFPGESPLGRQINTGLDGRDRYVTVVGVVEDVRNRGPAVPTLPAYVRPLAQPAAFGGESVTLALRSDGDPGPLVPEVKRAVWSVAPDAPFGRIQAGRELGREYARDVRFVLGVLGAFAFIALLLGGVGIYGVAASSARRRTREIGIRIALGAARSQASGLIVREGLWLAALGTAFGAAAASALLRLLSSLLYGVRTTDPATYAAVAALLLTVALLATWIPARWAGAVDPMEAMRVE